MKAEKFDPRPLRNFIVRALILSLVINGFIGLAGSLSDVNAQRRVIIVNADQPNVWTLEQAHYLLAQMHRRNLDLRAKKLEDLDPNAINGLRFDLLRMLVEAGASFSEASGVTNRLLKQNKEFSADRRTQLISERDKLRQESLQLTRELADLETKKASATSQEDKDRLAAEIAAKTSLRAKVDKEIELDDNELKTLGDGSGEFKSTEPQVAFDKSKLPDSVFDEAFKATTKSLIERFNQSPSLNASLMLDNFLQMQYEIVSKQLTLLRDEVGPGERLLFLELPQTVNASHHEANKKWAQSWWRIVGYSKKTSAAEETIQPNEKPTSTSQKVTGVIDAIHGRRSAGGSDLQYIDLDRDSSMTATLWNGVRIDNRLVRTVELIPRQSSLNVNDMKLRTRAGAFSGVASFLFGFGARVNIQRQREQFSQFVQQELYSSAFGKGSREFGWTFTPMPGTDRLSSGVRTTYAVVIAPEEATSLVLESSGCYFPRSAYQPTDFANTKSDDWVTNRSSRGCTSGKAFIVPIPGGGSDTEEDFWIRGISYQPVPKGGRVVVLISGYNFSSQIGALVNGRPLTQEIGLAQPLIRDDSNARSAANIDSRNSPVTGTMERVDANKLVLTFDLGPNFKGTPTITLVAPNKAIDINWLNNVSVNEIAISSLAAYPTKMFGSVPAPPPFRIDSVDVFRASSGGLNVLVHGAGFKPTLVPGLRELYVNGVRRTFRATSSELIEVPNFPAPADETIQVTLVYDDDTIASDPVPNPAFMRVNRVTIVSYEAGNEKKPGVLVVKIEGLSFPAKLEPSDPKRMKVTVTSGTEAYLTITNPGEAEVVTLTDPVTGVGVNVVVTRKPPPKQ